MTIFPRVIPVLTIRNRLLVKPLRFGKEKYVGDPVNAVRIFNEKEVDEIVFVDLTASENPGKIDSEFLEEIASEAFMPVGYGGGVNSVAIARNLVGIGVEKVIVNSAIATSTHILRAIADEVGSQSTVASVDYRAKRFGGHQAYAHRGTTPLGVTPQALAQQAVVDGAGEVILHAIDRERTFSGYDLRTITEVSALVTVPVVALGGARGLPDFHAATVAGASATAAGSAFVLHGKHEAVLITYPSSDEIRRLGEK